MYVVYVMYVVVTLVGVCVCSVRRFVVVVGKRHPHSPLRYHRLGAGDAPSRCTGGGFHLHAWAATGAQTDAPGTTTATRAASATSATWISAAARSRRSGAPKIKRERVKGSTKNHAK